MKRDSKGEKGFTLIELLTVIATIGVLAGITIQSYRGYKAQAAYAVVQQTVGDGRVALEAALTDVDSIFAPVANVTLSTPGAPTDPAVFAAMPGFRLPRATKAKVSFQPTCVTASCELASLQVQHCKGDEYSSWARYGDGTELLLNDLAGSGCP